MHGDVFYMRVVCGGISEEECQTKEVRSGRRRGEKNEEIEPRTWDWGDEVTSRGSTARRAQSWRTH